jgi:arsenate reductase
MDEAKMSDAAILDAIVTHPILLERPIVVEGDEARICRPADRVKRFLNAEDRSPPEG